MCSATVGPDVCIGSGTTIGESACISESIIGRNCRIGKKVVLHGCYLQDGVVIQDDAHASFALMCDRVTIKAGAVVSPGAVLSYRVVIAAKHVVPPYTRLSLCKQTQKEHLNAR